MMFDRQPKSGIWRRRRARRALVQAAYQSQVSGLPLAQIEKDFLEHSLRKGDKAFFSDVFRKMSAQESELDEMIKPFLNIPVDKLDFLERGVLRLAATEIQFRHDVPFKVVIDEYVELTKIFGAEEAYKFVNGVLDGLGKRYRDLELNNRDP